MVEELYSYQVKRGRETQYRQPRTLLRLLSIVLFLFYLYPNDVTAQVYSVTMIVDGDRLVLADGRKIKLAGIDAPEKHPSDKLSRDAISLGLSEDAVISQGTRAAAYLAEIAGGMQVQVLEMDKGDGSGYVSALVYVADDVGRPIYCLNEKMLSAGYAISKTKEENLAARYSLLERKAKLGKKGLWVRGDIFVAPQKVVTRSADAVTLSASCARDSACVWVSQGADPTIGIWESKPGKRCSCAGN